MIGFIYKNLLILSDLDFKTYIEFKEKSLLIKKDFYLFYNNKVSYSKSGEYSFDKFEKIVIDEDFDKSKLLNEFIYKSKNFIFILNLDIDYECKKFKTTFSSIKEAEEFLISFIETSNNKEEFVLIFNELFLNAYEHGNLGLTFDDKANLLENDKYVNFIKETTNDKTVYVCLGIYNFKDKKYLICRIEDEGKGFEFKNKKSIYNGRGIILSEKYCDALFYNDKKNIVSFIKEIL